MYHSRGSNVKQATRLCKHTFGVVIIRVDDIMATNWNGYSYGVCQDTCNYVSLVYGADCRDFIILSLVLASEAVPQHWKEFILQCMESDPNRRPSLTKLFSFFDNERIRE